MTDSAYPDLAKVEDWLNAKGYTGEAGACHAAMDKIREQARRIAELQQEVCSLIRRDPNDDLIERQAARIDELKAALRPFAKKADDILNNLSAGQVNYISEFIAVTLGDLRAARAAYMGEKDDDTMSDAEWEQVSQLSSKV